MFGMTREMVNEVKKEYPPGVTVQLVYTRDIKHPIAEYSAGSEPLYPLERATLSAW